jgi:hypothetical protein
MEFLKYHINYKYIMDKEIRVKFEEPIAEDLIGIIKVTDSIREGLDRLMKMGNNNVRFGNECIISTSLLILNPTLILNEEVDSSELDRDHSSDGIPEIVGCSFSMCGKDEGYFAYRIYDYVDEGSECEDLEITSETVNVKDILEL